MSEPQYLPHPQRRMITLSIMAAAIMNQVDTTIANVALPHMQGTTSASREQISWVLTSYIIAMAITTPLCGWLAERYGRKRVLLTSIAGFTLVSGLCGISTHLFELVLFRFLQGMFGAALIPISQVILMTLNPPEERGKSMAIFGLGFIMGPLIGPLLGGWLTENYSWHWVFLINLPVGVLAFLGTLTYLPEHLDKEVRPFDMLGFGLLALSIGMLQLVFDRGHSEDWFQSTEICIEAGVAALSFFLFMVHAFTARHPFVRLEMFRDRNFSVTCVLGLVTGIMMFGTISLLPPMLSGLFGEPIMDVGLVMSPRGLGTFFATMIVGRLMGRVHVRYLALVGLLGNAFASYSLSTMALNSDMTLIMVTGFINGFAMSFLFVPLSTTAFASLPPQYMNEASAISTELRYIGSAAGISAVQVVTSHNEAVVQSRLTEGLRPDNPVFDWASGIDLSTLEGAGRATYDAVRQAMMVAYVDTFWMLCLICLAGTPLVFLLRMPKRPAYAEGGSERPTLAME